MSAKLMRAAIQRTLGMLEDGAHDNTFTIGVRSPGV